MRGLDPVSDDKNLKKNLEKAFKLDAGSVELKSVRTNQNEGTRTRIFVIPAKLALKVKEVDKVQVGYVVAQVTILPDITRCYKCYHFGRIARNCKMAIDGGEICRRCGNTEYSMAECTCALLCMLCSEAKLPLGRLGHIAGTLACPRYKEALGETISRSIAGKNTQKQGPLRVLVRAWSGGCVQWASCEHGTWASS